MYLNNHSPKQLLEGEILHYDLKGFRQCLSPEGKKRVRTTKILYHFFDKLREAGRRELCEQCMQTWLAYKLGMLVLTLYITIPFARRLSLTVLHATTLPGALATCCSAQIHRVPDIIPPRPKCLNSLCKPALPSLPLADFLQSESLGSLQCLGGHLNLSDPLMKFLKRLHKSSSLRTA